MPKSSRSKGQFFIVSAVIIISFVSLLAIFFQNIYRPNPTYASLYPELEQISMIKESLCSVVKTRDNFGENVFSIHLNEIEERLREYFLERGMILSISHVILPDKVIFNYNITSPGFKSESKIFCE